MRPLRRKQQLAELLAAITLTKYPEIDSIFGLQISYLKEVAEGQGQLFKKSVYR